MESDKVFFCFRGSILQFLKVNYSLQVLQLAQILLYSHSPILSKVYLQFSPQDYRGHTWFWVGLHFATLQILFRPTRSCASCVKPPPARSNAMKKRRWDPAGRNGWLPGWVGGSLLPTGDGISMHFCLFVV